MTTPAYFSKEDEEILQKSKSEKEPLKKYFYDYVTHVMFEDGSKLFELGNKEDGLYILQLADGVKYDVTLEDQGQRLKFQDWKEKSVIKGVDYALACIQKQKQRV